MDISSDHGGISSDKLIDYFTKHFLNDLKKMVETKEELAKRQGAIAAVDQTLALKAEAEAVLEKSRLHAETVEAELAAREEATKTAAANAANRQKALDAAEKAFAKKMIDAEADLAVRIKACETREAANEKLSAELDARSQKLGADTAALNARIKDFQAKVANIAA